MANRLITIEQAAEDLRKVIADAAAESERAGIAPEVFAEALSMYFAGLGGFPIGKLVREATLVSVTSPDAR